MFAQTMKSLFQNTKMFILNCFTNVYLGLFDFLRLTVTDQQPKQSLLLFFNEQRSLGYVQSYRKYMSHFILSNCLSRCFNTSSFGQIIWRYMIACKKYVRIVFIVSYYMLQLCASEKEVIVTR